MKKYPFKCCGWPGSESLILKTVMVTGLTLFFVPEAHATQAHGGIEGILTHQVGHMLFMISMATFALWLHRGGLMKNKGWREIYYAALFFVFWNLDVICVHLLDEQMMLVDVQKVEDLIYRIDSSSPMLEWFYFFAKHDHILCVPALIFLYMGLKKLLETSLSRRDGVKVTL